MPAQKKSAPSRTASKPSNTKTSSNTRKPSAKKAPPVRPIRRGVGSLVTFLLSIFGFLILFGTQALVLDVLKIIVTTLIGRGAVIVPFALLFVSLVLLFHRGRPVTLRVTALSLSPVILGMLLHVTRFKAELPKGWAFFGGLADSGQALESGGVVSGTIGFLLKSGLSAAGAVIVLLVVLLALLLAAFQTSVAALYDRFVHWLHNRQPYDPDDFQAPPKPERPERQERSAPSRREKPQSINVPLYLTDEQMGLEPGQDLPPARTPRAKTPAEALRETPAPVPVPNVFTFDKQMYVDPSTGELLESPVTAGVPVEPEADIPPFFISPLEGQAAAQDDTPPFAVTPDTALPFAPAASEPPFTPDEPPTQPAPVSAPPRPIFGSSKGPYAFPSMDLLAPPAPAKVSDQAEEMRMGATRLIEVLESFGINAQMFNITRGPSVTRYELEMGSGAKLKNLTSLSKDIAMSMGTADVNIMPIQGKMGVVGIEVPNRVRTMVTLREVLESQEFQQRTSPTTFALGKDISGKCIVDDIAKMPHLLVAGSTGAGKSVAINTLIVSLLFKARPEELKLILIDPKKVEFPPYNGIPHLGFGPVITDSDKAAAALEWAVLEMEKRYATLADSGKRDIDGYNSAYPDDDPEHPKMCRIVIIIDEMADLMMESKKERNMEDSIVRIAQKARACGIHLVLATQRPDAKVITGLIKANVPSRIALKVSSAINSRIVLDEVGAEKLIGYGDMLFAPGGSNRFQRIQGCFVDERDIHKIVSFIQTANEPVAPDEEAMEQLDRLASGGGSGGSPLGGDGDSSEADPMLPEAIEYVVMSGQGSVSTLQRRLKVGHSRAGRLMDMMEERGIVGPFEGSKPRRILITPEEWEKMKALD